MIYQGVHRLKGVGLGRLTALLATFAFVLLLAWPHPAGAGQEGFDPWKLNWGDPWAASQSKVPEQPLNSSTIPTLGDAGFWPLLRAVSMYEQIRDWGGWKAVPAGEKIEKGQRDQRMALIRERLLATGDLSASNGDPQLYSDEVYEAVRRFQRRHGLAADGIIGPRTIQAMNVPVEKRIAQIKLNLDRLNEQSGKLGKRYIFVNIAGQEVEAVANGRVEMRRRVVVGKTDRQTPEYTSAINYITFNPYWNVPQSIARRDIIPKVQRDPGYLKRMGIRVLSGYGPNPREIDPYSVDWSSASAQSLRLRQDPSRRNSLGTVRIHFPNPHAVYLHDTPSKSLFSRVTRAYSSGCVRVDQVHDLVEWLLQDTPGWDRGRIDRVVQSGENTDVSLAATVPVYMMYLTAWVSEDGAVNFRDDIYSLDRQVHAASVGG